LKDELAAAVARHGDDPAILRVLEEVCRLTGMGFAAVACVTEDRWIACQVLDKIEFGLKPGDELDIATTICDDIRKCGRAVIIDHVAEDRDWRTHPTPVLYGFKSYASFPLFLDDGSFYGTMCAIDPEPRLLKSPELVAKLENCAIQVSDLLSAKIAASPRLPARAT
jgi:GAF domain-containing protein